MTDDETTREQTEQVLAALGRIRGRRGPRPGTAHESGGQRDLGSNRDPGSPGVSGMRDDPAVGPWVRHPHPGAPDWFGGPGARLGGPARFRLLEALAAAGTSLSVSQVADAVGVDQPRASRLIQQAVDHGLVRREPDPDDARRTRVLLTDTGVRFAKGSRGHRHELIGTALASMSDADRAEFVRLFTQFAAAWPEE